MGNDRYILAVNPLGKNEPKLNLIYSQTKVLQVRKLGFWGAIKEAAELVPCTLQYPDSIFSGSEVFSS
jgi:hypothetical protein